MKNFRICIVVVLLAWVSAQNPVVNTRLGPVEGRTYTIQGMQGTASLFLGIPYAAPPVGDLRLAPPQDPTSWTSNLDTGTHGPMCPQQINEGGRFLKFNMSARVDPANTDEACLSLDVYTPALSGSRSVMVFIHGGGLTSGNSRYDGRYLALGKDVVAVYIQHRLGALGWMATGDGVIQGNMGFMDQGAALKWVKANIDRFGGNPDDVTIYGVGAGAWSVSLHMVSPKSAGLFHKAILQSGSLVGSSFFSPPVDMLTQTKQLTEAIGCDSSNSQDMLTCLRSVTDIELFWTNIAPSGAVPFTTVPFVDGTYFPDHPTQMVKSGNFHKNIPVIVGCMEIEGFVVSLFYTSGLLAPNFDLNQFEELAVSLALEYAPNKPEKHQEIAKAMTMEYAKNLSGNELKRVAAEMVGDVLITLSAYTTVTLLSAEGTGNLYFYDWRYRPSVVTAPDFIHVDHAYDIVIMGSTKTGLTYFGVQYDDYTQDDKDMDELMLSYWSNFAKTGDPNGNGLAQWPSFRTDSSYLKLQLQPEVAKDYKADRMKFWMETVPAIISAPNPVVLIKSGKLEGRTYTIEGDEGMGFIFLGIPYAAPPINNLRFAPPQEPKPWNETHNSGIYGPMCPQDSSGSAQFLMFAALNFSAGTLDIPMDEDCLNLNVYTPGLTGSRSVMVFIHGGGFTFGNSLNEGRFIALEKNVVAVYIQYRLGALGWMASGDGVIEGNMGFMDQVAALKWVKANIDRFGGNPDDVTIYGLSAGAWSVSLHLVSPKSSGLFQKAILQSGSTIGTNLFAPPVDMPRQTRQLAEAIGCDSSNSQDMLECLLSVTDISLFWKNMMPVGTVPFFTFPYLDGVYFPAHPTDLVKSNNFDKKVPVIAGCMAIEGFSLALSFGDSLLDPNFTISMFEETYVRPLLQIYAPDKPEKHEELVMAILKEYAADLTGDDLRRAAAELVGDIYITIGTYQTVKLLSSRSTGNIYFYNWRYSPSVMKRPDFVVADHADELYILGSKSGMLFGIPYDGFTKNDKIMDEMMSSYWTNFAKTGNPNGDGLFNWPAFSQDGSYIVLQPNPQVASGYKAERMKFWMETAEAILNDDANAAHTSQTYTILLVTAFLIAVMT